MEVIVLDTKEFIPNIQVKPNNKFMTEPFSKLTKLVINFLKINKNKKNITLKKQATIVDNKEH